MYFLINNQPKVKYVQYLCIHFYIDDIALININYMIVYIQV